MKSYGIWESLFFRSVHNNYSRVLVIIDIRANQIKEALDEFSLEGFQV